MYVKHKYASLWNSFRFIYDISEEDRTKNNSCSSLWNLQSLGSEQGKPNNILSLHDSCFLVIYDTIVHDIRAIWSIFSCHSLCAGKTTARNPTLEQHNPKDEIKIYSFWVFVVTKIKVYNILCATLLGFLHLLLVVKYFEWSSLQNHFVTPPL